MFDEVHESSTVTFNDSSNLLIGKPVSLLRELTSSWSSEPVCVKYSLKDEREFVVADSGSTVYGDGSAKNSSSRSEISADNNRPLKCCSNKTKAKTAMRTDTVIAGPVNELFTINCDRRLSSDETCIQKRAQILRQCTEYLELESAAGGYVYTKATFRRAFLNKDVCSQIFQLFDHDDDGLLSPDDWIRFIKERLLNEKQSDLAELIESVAYELCGNTKITCDKFQHIFHNKGVCDKIFRFIDKDNDGNITPQQITDVINTLTSIRVRTGFDEDSLEWLEQLFRQTVGNEKEIRKDDFKKILITKNPFFTERVFQIFDKDHSNSISLQEFLDAMHQFAGQSPDDKIKFLFNVYDLDGDGLIQQKELQHVMRACMEENGMRFSEGQIEDLTNALFEDADFESRGAITYSALKNQLEKHEGLLENLSISIDRWLLPPKLTSKPVSFFRKLISLRPYQLTLPYIKNNYVYLSFLGLFLFINLLLFVTGAMQYSEWNYYVIFARAAGQCLNFNCAFTLVLMLRHCITLLRTRGASSFLPLDQHIYLHKLTGMFICFYSLLHTTMHLLNLMSEVLEDSNFNGDEYSAAVWLLTTEPGFFGLIDGFAYPTGVVLIILLVIMFVCSQPFVRRGGSFEIFYWTHLLYVPFWILLILHGPNFWKWLLAPGLIYLCERIYRFSVTSSKRGKTYISSGLLLPSRVTHLVIKRPPHFDFHPGDYVFVNIPAIAHYEWHPFTISSAPEQEDYMWLHVRGVGEWTNRLYDYFKKEQERLHNINENLPIVSNITHPNGTVKLATDDTELKLLKATLDGPLSGKSGYTIHGKPNHKRQEIIGYNNPTFSELPEDFRMQASILGERSNTGPETNKTSSQIKKHTDEKLHKFLLKRKIPLSKSLSMPDMDNRIKKRERLLALREYMRSESEKSFDECQMKRARLQSLGLAYLSPQNKSIARSFRYMRHKPTIIAFKTPSLENCEANLNARSNQDYCVERTAEEDKLSDKNQDNSSQIRMNYPVGKPLEIYIDGPYGAPSSHIFRAQHAVLVATGIGVTPFASILQSIMHRYWKARHTCPRCKYAWVSDIPSTIMHLRKVDFFWINRDQRSFEWFVNLLSQLEIEQAELGGSLERFLEMHMYITSALQKTDMKAVGLQLALDLLHEKEKRDLITGLKTRTNAGRPNWDKVFKQLTDQKKGKVTVFYCGPPQLGRHLRMKCDQYGFSFRKETF